MASSSSIERHLRTGLTEEMFDIYDGAGFTFDFRRHYDERWLNEVGNDYRASGR